MIKELEKEIELKKNLLETLIKEQCLENYRKLKVDSYYKIKNEYETCYLQISELNSYDVVCHFLIELSSSTEDINSDLTCKVKEDWTLRYYEFQNVTEITKEEFDNVYQFVSSFTDKINKLL